MVYLYFKTNVKFSTLLSGLKFAPDNCFGFVFFFVTFTCVLLSDKENLKKYEKKHFSNKAIPKLYCCLSQKKKKEIS